MTLADLIKLLTTFIAEFYSDIKDIIIAVFQSIKSILLTVYNAKLIDIFAVMSFFLGFVLIIVLVNKEFHIKLRKKLEGKNNILNFFLKIVLNDIVVALTMLISFLYLFVTIN